ncbi:MAG TPA: FAD:protein FMN transferase [Candidatus Limnocylindrales bacterium]|nr:FAD:protein FMN transferase [Candidatus Limnocylindrales bacterium]
MTDTSFDFVSWTAPQMGGRTEVTIAAEQHRRAVAGVAARRAGQRIAAWADRLTRFDERSDLSLLNASAESSVAVRPMLGATLRWAATASERTAGIVDPTLLHARLAAETGSRFSLSPDASGWAIRAAGRTTLVDRTRPTRFDLDGIAKGWLADRAVDLLSEWSAVAVDADGDICVRLDAGMEWLIDVADPRASGAHPLATLRLTGGQSWSQTYGIATSGTTVHRWQIGHGHATHHLIDPRTGVPADTDVVQATVLAPTAREAEALAKAAIIHGSHDALLFLNRSAALTAILLLETGDVAAMPGIDRWLA